MENDKGSIETFCRQILSDAEIEAEKNLEKARAVSQEKKKIALSEVERYREEVLEKARDQARKIKKRFLSSVGLESKKILLREKGGLIARAMEKLKEKFGEFAHSDKYRDFIKNLIIESIAALKGADFLVEVSETNLNLVNEAMFEEIKTELAEKHTRTARLRLAERRLEDDPGVKVYTDDHRVLYDNTIASMFSRYNDDLRLLIHKELFE